MTGILRGIAVPNFGEDPAGLIELGVAVEQAGFDGFFLWDHIVFSDSGDGPPIADPWLVLGVVATRTSRIKLGTMITPVPRRRPWQLARQTTTLDRLSGGRVILGVGIGSPAYADFGIFHEPQGARERADLLDEGLDVLAGLWTGERFSYSGQHFTVDPVRFTPPPVQRPRIPVWVGGILPATRTVDRAARWDGMVPIRYTGGQLATVSPEDIAELGVRIGAIRDSGPAAGSRPDNSKKAQPPDDNSKESHSPSDNSKKRPAGGDLVVWAEAADAPGAVPEIIRPYEKAGATWWIESARPGDGWWDGVRRRVAAGR
jgi:alkanesulfonate monooxygenase SsuD/methylene tetrahydromethanopterin reductase-like flavin-dependent oxidoreductase (luciferase family)